MDREIVRRVMNRKLGRFLYRTRVRSQLGFGEVASAVGWPTERLIEIERAPAEVPCRQLYQLIAYYGPECAAEAQLVIFDAQVAIRSKRWPLILAISLPQWSSTKIARGAFRFAIGLALYQLLKEAFKTLIFGRMS